MTRRSNQQEIEDLRQINELQQENNLQQQENDNLKRRIRHEMNDNLYVDKDDNVYEVSEDIPYEKESAKKGFLLSALSIDEARLSVLILCLLLTIIFGGVNYVLVGDITANLTNIIITLIYAIAGVNITSSIVNSINNKGERSEMIVSARDADSNKKKFSLKRIFSL